MLGNCYGPLEAIYRRSPYGTRVGKSSGASHHPGRSRPSIQGTERHVSNLLGVSYVTYSVEAISRYPAFLLIMRQLRSFYYL